MKMPNNIFFWLDASGYRANRRSVGELIRQAFKDAYPGLSNDMYKCDLTGREDNGMCKRLEFEGRKRIKSEPDFRP